MDITSSQGLLCKLQKLQNILNYSNKTRFQGRKGGSVLHCNDIPVRSKAASDLNTI